MTESVSVPVLTRLSWMVMPLFGPTSVWLLPPRPRGSMTVQLKVAPATLLLTLMSVLLPEQMFGLLLTTVMST